MSAPPVGTVLQVQCGSCLKIVNVPANFLDRLLLYKMYNCPHCKSRQSIHLTPQQMTTLRFQARQMMQTAEAEARQMMQAAKAEARQQLQQQQQQGELHAGTSGQGASQASASQAPTAAAVLQALQALAASHQKATASAVAATAAPHPASLLGQLQQLMQQQQQRRQASESQGAQPAATFTQQQLELLRQITDRNSKTAAALAASGSAHLAQAQLERFLPLTNEPSPDEEDDADDSEVRDTFMEYKPARLTFGKPHPDAVVETASLAAVEPPEITYQLKAHKALVDTLSALQLESVVYACQRHQQMLPDGSRGGFFIGDGAGVGKGRTIAGLILENWKQGRRKHLWLSVGSDLKIDTKRDLDDVGADDLPLHALNKLPYGKLSGHKIGIKEGVIFLTYSSLISSSDRGHTRFKQLVEWCGNDFNGLIVFDESHKAKNLVPDAGMRATQVGLKVRELQLQLPQARVIYCSATGASEPRNMGYMVRLGLWGEGNPAFRDFGRFLDAVQGKNGTGGGTMAALELVAMDMKAQGMYVCRTLSFAGAEFETVEAPLEEPMGSQYAAASATWNQLFREFLYAEEQAAAAGEAGGGPSGMTTVQGGRRRGGTGDQRSMTWRNFWAGHQAFFRHMTMSAKVPAVVRMARAAVANGKCAVIGLQSTGEARTADVVADKGDELDDFVSGPKELLLRLVDNYYPLPPDPNAEEEEADSDSDEDFQVPGVAEAVARNALEGRNQVYRGAKARVVRYKEWSESEDIGNSSSGSDSTSGSGGSSSASDDGGKGEEAGEVMLDGDVAEAGPARRSQRSAQPASGNPSSEDGSDGKSRKSRVAGRQRRRQQSRSSEEGSGDEYDPAIRRASASSPGSTSSSCDDSSSSSSEEDEGEEQQQRRQQREQESKEAVVLKARKREERREAKRVEAEMRAMRRAHAEAAYKAALARKDAVMAVVQQLDLPNNPLDTLIDQLGGPSEVAEMTGRKGRLIRSKSSTGVVFEARNASGVAAGATLEMINVHERELFLSGKKLIAIISEAASAGISLHADRRAVNQRRRLHLTLELPWSADKAIQQFGRTHRANQAHGPQYRLIFTPLGGERRFAAAVARRLESLGALTQGDRRAGPSLSAFNYESVWGQRALREMYRAIMRETRVPLALPQPCRPGPADEPPQVSLEVFLGKARALLLNCGIIRHNKAVVSGTLEWASHINEYLSRPDGAPPSVGRIDEKDMADVPRFLNRLLGLAPEAQQTLFDFYQVTLEALMDKARREGALDEGIVDIKAHAVSLVGEPRVLHRDATTGAATVMYEVELDRGLPWADARQKLEEHRQQLALEEAGLTSPSSTVVPAILASIPAAEQEQWEGKQNQQEQPQQGGEKEEAVVKQQKQQVKEEEEQERSQHPSNGALPVKQEQQEDYLSDAAPAAKEAAVKEEEEVVVKPASTGTKRQRQGKAGSSSAAAATAAEDKGRSSAAKRRRANRLATASGKAAALPSKPKQQQQQKRMQPADAETIDLTLSDSEGDGKATAAAKAAAKVTGKKQSGAADGKADGKSDGDDEVEEVPGEGSGTSPAKARAKAAAKQKWESGFYRARQEGINRQVHVLLALQVEGSEPPTFAIHRPATGRSRLIMSLQELKARYQLLEPTACQPLWEKAYEAASGAAKDKRSGASRKRTLHILGGAVMRSWGAVQHALVQHVRSSERRMRVLRIATTGEQPQRLVGMLIPEPAVAEVVAQLSQGDGEEGKAKVGEDAKATAAADASDGDSGGGDTAAVAGRNRGGGRGGGAEGGCGWGRGQGGAAQSPSQKREHRQQPQRRRTRKQQAAAQGGDEEEMVDSESSSEEQEEGGHPSSLEESPDEHDGSSSTEEETEDEESPEPSEGPSAESCKASAELRGCPPSKRQQPMWGIGARKRP